MTIHQTMEYEPRVKAWTSEEYFQLAREGHFQGQHVQLIDGEIIEMSPQGYPHSAAVELVIDELRRIFGPTRWVRGQSPILLGRYSAPEPDVAVIANGPRHYSDHPSEALLLVEVSDSSLHLDRHKAAIYAKVAPEYWILNLPARELEVYRTPVPDPQATSGMRYEQHLVLKDTDEVSPVARPEQRIAIASLLP